ncbi:putative hydro-lyase [Arthrobacter sp. ISL-72]|uniref:putative hydro-lyase n=1 Tax=Arthrobacter sp. ISL-72 TaxID=2819114 RepID=UPI001BECAB55|nr:putative hydro-lyase [Arthrobacter sp. ISL-72]MBT2593723.1 putative hydro-lyase [Arthrobacter sp. ISL-72]
MNPANALMAPSDARLKFRNGLVTPTSGWSDGYTQANLIAVTADYADEFIEFCRLNPKACPVIDIIPAGRYESALAAGSDIRSDIPAYRVWVDGELADEVADVSPGWRDDMVGVLIGCSFTFEAALASAGIPLRHTETGRNVPMYRTNIECSPAGRIHGPMVVSMRPMPPELVETAIRVTLEVPKVHGSPVHVGSPEDLGIIDINRPDFGDAVEIRPGEVPVFWACGVTPQSAVMASRPPFAISHAPGHMFITDVPESTYRESAGASL